MTHNNHHQEEHYFVSVDDYLLKATKTPIRKIKFYGEYGLILTISRDITYIHHQQPDDDEIRKTLWTEKSINCSVYADRDNKTIYIRSSSITDSLNINGNSSNHELSFPYITNETVFDT